MTDKAKLEAMFREFVNTQTRVAETRSRADYALSLAKQVAQEAHVAEDGLAALLAAMRDYTGIK